MNGTDIWVVADSRHGFRLGVYESVGVVCGAVRKAMSKQQELSLEINYLKLSTSERIFYSRGPHPPPQILDHTYRENITTGERNWTKKKTIEKSVRETVIEYSVGELAHEIVLFLLLVRKRRDYETLRIVRPPPLGHCASTTEAAPGRVDKSKGRRAR